MAKETTKQVIREAVLEMMEETPMHSIKVTKVVEATGIGRSTFYMHYDSVYDAIEDIEAQFFEGLRSIYSIFWTYPRDDRYLKEPHPVTLKVLEYLRANETLIKTLWGPYGDPLFQVRCRKEIEKGFFPEEASRQDVGSTEMLNRAFFVGGHLAQINAWLFSKSRIPDEEMALVVYKSIDALSASLSL